MPKIEFTADAAIVSERRSDHSYKVALETGEYSQKQMAEIVLIPKDVEIKTTLEW